MPRLAIGQQWLEQLALRGVPWLNVRPVTVPSLAAELALPDLLRRGWQPASDDSGLLITEQALRAVGGYFADVAALPGVARAVYRSLTEVRLAGLGPDDLPPAAFVDPAKGEAFRAVLAAYAAGLEANGLADAATVLHLALARVRAGTGDKPVYIVPAGLRLSALEGKLLQRLTDGRRHWLRADPVYGLELPQRAWLPAEAGGGRFTGRRNPDDPSDSATSNLLSWLFAPAAAPRPAADLQLFHAVSPHAEVREVLRRIVASHGPWDAAEIVCTAAGTYGPIIYEAAAKLGIPVTFAEGLPVLTTAPGRAALALLTWIKSDWQTESLRQALAAGDLTVPRSNGGDAQPSARAVARQLRQLGIGWGRERYLPAIEAALDGSEEDSYRRPALLALRSLCRALLAALPQPGPAPAAGGSGDVRLGELAAGLAQVLKDFAAVRNPRDAEAREQLTTDLAGLAGVATARLPLPDAVDWLLAWLERQTCGAGTPQPGHLHVSGFRHGSGSGRPLLFVVGLDAARFPGTGLQDPILLDAERQRLSPHLPLAAERLRENTHDLAALLAGATGQVTLSYAAADPADGARRFPAPLLLQAYRLQQGKPDADYSALAAALGTPIGYAPGGAGAARAALDATDWWLGQIALPDRLAHAEQAALGVYPGIKAGLAAEQARASNDVTEWDGQIEPDAAALDPRLNAELVLSASGIEMLATCPLKYFFHYVLRVRPPDDLEYDPARWLDPMQRGTLLHDIFAQFLTGLAERGERAAASHLPELLALAERLIAAMREAVPPPSPQVFAAEQAELLRTCELFLKLEADPAMTGTPRFFELDVGYEQPVVIDLGDGAAFRFRGRIDRIDALGGGRYQVWDYKTGSAWGYDADDYVRRGRQVQHALYALAVEHYLREQGEAGATVIGSGYMFPTERGEGQRLNRPQGPENRQVLQQALRHLFDLAAAGTFVAAEDKHGCRFCDYREICGGERAAERTKEKLKAGAPKLGPLKEVAGLE